MNKPEIDRRHRIVVNGHWSPRSLSADSHRDLDDCDIRPRLTLSPPSPTPPSNDDGFVEYSEETVPSAIQNGSSSSGSAGMVADSSQWWNDSHHHQEVLISINQPIQTPDAQVSLVYSNRCLLCDGIDVVLI